MIKAEAILRNQVFPACLLIINCIVFVFSFIYIKSQEMSILWNLYGYLLLVSLLGNTVLALLEKKRTGISSLYLFLQALFHLVIMLVNTAVSVTPTNFTSQSTVSATLLICLLILGGALALEKFAGHSIKQDKKSDNDQSIILPVWMIKLCRTGKYMIVILLSMVLYFGLFLAINLLRTHKNGLLEVFLSAYALFYAIIFSSVGILIRKLLNQVKYKLYSTIVTSVTIIIFIIFLLPVVFIPVMQSDARTSYEKSFGQFTSTMIHPTGFRKLPFSLPEYFLGIPSGDYEVTEDILYYEGSEGVDRGLKLYFDVYQPAYEDELLPGERSVLIRIHGGAWTSGDKGIYNFAQMNKYFASRGYVVFDIQYGLNDTVDWINPIKVDQTRLGNYTIDDMVRHIGIFTDYLTKHKEEYHANINSVFISGGSAGGQLALAAGLAIADGGYSDVLNPKLKIKGLIPFYPANGLSQVFQIGGREELIEPERLVKQDSPPCLIFQGSHDGLVDIKIARELEQKYQESGNKQCAIIVMPFGGHASDIYFSGYYNQIFLYYMERFMYQFH